MAEFDPISSLAGGVLIGIAAGVLWVFNGRLAGISGIFGDALGIRLPEIGWRWMFVAGLIAGGVAMYAIEPGYFPRGVQGALPVAIAGGLLVGIGTRMGSGCTSGHGVCGIARVSPRSIAATLIFMATGGITVFVTNHLLGGL
ncbi:MAG: YeeE/YedE family protein [SAR324 cluster bacterium]|nr:YeeE/YedE family protein [SAR324 cluster bacterium]